MLELEALIPCATLLGEGVLWYDLDRLLVLSPIDKSLRAPQQAFIRMVRRWIKTGVSGALTGAATAWFGILLRAASTALSSCRSRMIHSNPISPFTSRFSK